MTPLEPALAMRNPQSVTDPVAARHGRVALGASRTCKNPVGRSDSEFSSGNSPRLAAPANREVFNEFASVVIRSDAPSLGAHQRVRGRLRPHGTVPHHTDGIWRLFYSVVIGAQ
jgi:hypothetical protein